jgi:hypothetical protein
MLGSIWTQTGSSRVCGLATIHAATLVSHSPAPSTLWGQMMLPFLQHCCCHLAPLPSSWLAADAHLTLSLQHHLVSLNCSLFQCQKEPYSQCPFAPLWRLWGFLIFLWIKGPNHGFTCLPSPKYVLGWPHSSSQMGSLCSSIYVFASTCFS